MHEAAPLLLSGRIVLPDGDARQRYVLIRDGEIRWISRSRPPAALVEGAREIRTGPQDWIFPGLIDLHTHTWYNLLPLWHSPRAPFDNRHVWRSDPGYKAAIGGVLKQLEGHVPARKVFSELQAVAGGTTLLDEPRPLDAEDGEGPTLLCRDTGSPEDLGLPAHRKIRSVVDFFKPGPDDRPHPAPGWDGAPGELETYETELAKRHATLVHLAEGRSGFGSYRGVDPYSRAEFEALMAHSAMRDAEAVRASRLSIVHGCGIDVDDARHVDFLVERGISIIWSPVSNLLLYGDTIDAEKLIQHGLTVALGSDWSPSGSKHVWDEAKFARFFLDAIGSPLADADIFKMVTTNPGRCLGLRRLGRIEEGAPADFFILRSPIESDNALEIFFTTTDRDVLATVVGGLPIYGDREFLEQFDLALQPLPRREGSAVVDKAVHLPASVGVEDFAAAVDALEDQLKALDPPTWRSNLLADSDVPYRRRMQFLRSQTERFGWSVKRWRRKKNAVPVGRVPVEPSSVRVRVGFGAEGAARDALGATVLPATAMLGRYAGATALFSWVTPSTKPEGCPDELGLSFYESREVYERTQKTVGGRAAELLEQAVFDFKRERSWSVFPDRFGSSVEGRRAYYLFDEAVDWHLGEVKAYLGARRVGVEVEAFHRAIVEALGTLQNGTGHDGALAIVDDDWVAFWAHPPAVSGNRDEALEALGAVAVRLVSATARDVEAKASLSDEFEGIDVDGREGDCLRLVFERRKLMPW